MPLREGCSQSENFHLKSKQWQKEKKNDDLEFTGHTCKHGRLCACLFCLSPRLSLLFLSTFLSGNRAAVKESDTMELAWDVDAFARHATCVLCRRMCCFKQFWFGKDTQTHKSHLWGELFRESDSNFHINTHKHRERREEGVRRVEEGR